MTQATDIHILKIEDTRYILGTIKDTVDIYEYPTTSIFSAVTRCSLISFLKGAGYPTSSLEPGSVSLFKQLNEYAHANSDYEWFIDWSKKLASFVKERSTLD